MFMYVIHEPVLSWKQIYPIKVPGYFSCLHVFWYWVGAGFMFSKELLGQFIVNISIWSDRSTADITSSVNISSYSDY